MKQSKKIIAIIMSIILLISATPMLLASADTDYHYSGIWSYTVENGDAIIQGIETEQTLSSTISIPETLDGYNVTGIEWLSYWDGEVDLFIPASITKIENSGWTAIGGGFNGITVAETNPAFASENGVLFNKDKSVLIRYPVSNAATNYTVPADVSTIDEYAFYNSFNLTDIIISENVTTIKPAAFSECYNLKNIMIGDGVTSIGDGAFIWCAALESVSIGNSVKTIGIDAFRGCESLKKITLPTNVTSIGKNALLNCYSLTSIEVANDNTNYSSDSSGVLFNKNKTELIQYPIGNKRTSYTIPDSTITIDQSAFCSSSNLQNITIPEGVITIGDSAFGCCEHITTIIIPNSVTTIDDWAFYNCKNLSSISIGTGLKTIGERAFYQCPSLTSVTLPDGITTVEPYAFCWSGIKEVYVPASIEELDCLAFESTKLTDVYFEGSREQWNKIEFKTDTENYDYSNGGEPFVLKAANIHFNYSIEPATGSCGEDAIWNYNGMGILTISGTGAMASYPRGENAPWNEYADNIQVIEIEEGITSIDGFYNCSDLETIILPESLEYIESCTFCWDYYDTREIIYKGMPEQWEKIEFGTHDSDGCFCYYIYGAIYIDNEDFVIDSLDILVEGSTTVKYGETTCLHANIPITINEFYKDDLPSDHSSLHDMYYYLYYFLPVGTRLNWYGTDDYGCFDWNSYSGEDYWFALTSMVSGSETVTVCLEDEDGYTIYNDDGEPIEASIELTSKAGIFEIIAYAFRSFFEMLLSFFMF